MKKICMYEVIDIKSGYALACGIKYKDFDNGKIRYINDCMLQGKFSFWRKRFFLFRTVTLKGRECVIVYWVNIRKRPLENFAYFFNGEYFLRAKNYMLPKYTLLCDYLIEALGVTV